MPIYHKRINGRKVWHVRVAYKGLAATRVCATKGEAEDAKLELAQDLRRRAAHAEQTGLAPATRA